MNIEKEELRQGLNDYLEKARVNEPSEWIVNIEVALVEFIRVFVDDTFSSVYEHTNRSFYDDVRKNLAISKPMRDADQQNDLVYSRALKLYSEFLQSKYFPKAELPQEKPEKKKPAKPQPESVMPTIPDEDPKTEGAKKHIEQERPYRNSSLRRDCIQYWGAQCQCCGMDFASLYGEELGKDYIEVHHLKPISSYEDEHDVDAVNDLVPLCANCHAMIHRGKDGPLTLGELRTQYRGQVWEITRKKED